MNESETIRKVQVKLNRLSLLVLGLLIAKTAKDHPLYRQILHAMEPAYDGERLSNADSYDALPELGNDRWPE